MSKEKIYALGKNDCKLLEVLGSEGFPIEQCGSKMSVPIPASKFLDLYVESDEAQISYEAGRANYTYKILSRLNKQSEEGQFKATEFIATNVATLKLPTGSAKRDTKGTLSSSKPDDSFKVKELAPHLFEPLLENNYVKPEPIIELAKKKHGNSKK